MSSQQQASYTPTNERDEYETPGYLMEYIRRKWGPLYDLACTEENAKFVRFGFAIDSLKIDWHQWGVIGFCNPPYSDIEPWLEKAIREQAQGFTTVFLIPTPNGEQRDHLIAKASEIEFIIGRIAFLRPDGTEARGNTRGSCIVVCSRS